MGLFGRRQPDRRIPTPGHFLSDVGWGPIGYRSEPLNTHPNDQYTTVPMRQPFTVAWQGFQKRQQERYMVTEHIGPISGTRNSYQGKRGDTGNMQRYGSWHQYSANYGPVPATQIMQAPSVTPQQTGALASFVRAVKTVWQAPS